MKNKRFSGQFPRGGTCLVTLSLLLANPGHAAAAGNKLANAKAVNPDSALFQQDLNAYLTDWEDALRPFEGIPVVQQKLAAAGLHPLDQISKARDSLAALDPDALAKVQATYAKFSGWREGPKAIKVLGEKFGARATAPAAPDIQVNAITADTCPNPNDVPSNTDIAATTAVRIAAEGVMEGFPTDGLTILARLIPVGIYIAAESAVLAVETLKDIDDDCNQLTAAGVQSIVTAATNAITNNDNSNTTSIITAIGNAQSAIVNNDDANKTTIINNDNTNKTTIVNNDNSNTANLTTAISNAQTNININNNSNTNTTTITSAIASAQTTIVNNDNSNKTTIINNDNSNKTAIISNDNANRDLLLRTQIEQDLSQADNATPVAMFVTTAARGGFIELVKTIVTDTLEDAQALGGSLGNAQTFLSQANSALAGGQYRSAYASYRKAYKGAANAIP